MRKGMVSIIVPVHNAELFLAECLKSICNQTYSNIEIILINDASEDLSEQICSQYQKHDERIILLNHDYCQGVSKTRNSGLLAATGEYVAFVDADDILENIFIEKLVETIEKHDIAIVGYRKFTELNEIGYVVNQLDCCKWEELMFHVLCTNKIGGYCFNKLYRKKIIEGIFFDSSLTMGEDFVFLIEYLKKCKNFGYVTQALYKYRSNPNSATLVIKNTKKFDTKKMSYIDAVDMIQQMMRDENEQIQSYVCYRVIRGNIWVMLQMIYCGVYDNALIKKICSAIRKNYRAYKKVRHGSIFQKITVNMIRICPRLLFAMGVLISKVFPNFFSKIVSE